MKFHLFPVWLVLVMVVSAPLSAALTADFEIDAGDVSAPVSLETLDSRIKDARASTALDEQTKAKLLGLYRKTSRYLEEVRSNNAASDAFIRSKKTDSAQGILIREWLDHRKQQESAVTLGITARTPFSVMQDYLFTEKANLEAVEAKLSDVEQQLTLAAARPNRIRQRLSEAMNRQEDITDQLLQPISDDEPALLMEA